MLWRRAIGCRGCMGAAAAAATCRTEFQKGIQHKNQFHSIQLKLTMTIFDIFFYLLYAMDPLFLFLALVLLFSSLVAIGFLLFGLTAHQTKPNRRRPRHYCLIQRCRLRRYRFVKGLTCHCQ